MANKVINDNPRTLDPQSRVMLYEGLNQSQLAILFRMDNRTIQRKIHHVEPTGYRNQVAIYNIADVAPFLCKPKEDIEVYIKRMHSSDLPKHLSKEFWNGQKARQDYELRAGDLWPTEDVIKHVSALMKLVRMSVQLTTDNLERADELTDKQRSIVQDQMRSMLEEMQAQVVKNFSRKKEEINDHGTEADTDDDEI